MTNFFNTIDPKLKITELLTFVKFSLYLIEILTSSQIFGTIYDKLRFRIGEKTYCFAYGNVFRCNFGVQMSFLGLIVAIYTLTLEIFSKYLIINIPPFMKCSELNLCSFRIGLWLITRVTLNEWFRKKFEKKYTRSSHYEDRLNRIQRMDKMIGKDVRNVRKMSKYTLITLMLSLIILMYEKWEKRDLKKEGKRKIN